MFFKREPKQVIANPNWWKGGVIYQIYPRSFMDSRSDGSGDLKGITMKLEYVASLGVDAIWLCPFYRSPMNDFGYDIADYRDVDPMFGSLDDFRALIAEAHRLNLKVIIDQILGYTAEEHEWFKESRSSQTNPRADWYIWADPKEDGSAPNNWLSTLGGSAWRWSNRRQQYYLHSFRINEPNLNFHCAAVRQAHLDTMRFWLDLGVDGLRLDHVNFYFHDLQLRNNPAIGPHESSSSKDAPYKNPFTWQQHLYDINRDETLTFIEEIKALIGEYPDRVLFGEIDSEEPLQAMARYTADRSRLDMVSSVDLLRKEHSADYLRERIAQQQSLAPDAWPHYALSDQDLIRSATRWGEQEDPDLYPRITLALLLSLRGTASIYQGEELGLPQAEVPFNKLKDPQGRIYWPEFKGRDGCRTPMPWTDSDHGGFALVEPWLPVDPRHLPRSVSEQEYHKNSMLKQLRRFIAWRKQQPALIEGSIEIIDGTGDALVFIRQSKQQKLLVALNLTGEAIYLPWDREVSKVHTEHGFTGRYIDGQIELPPYQALYAELTL